MKKEFVMPYMIAKKNGNGCGDTGASYGDTKICQILKYGDSGAGGFGIYFIVKYVFIYVSCYICIMIKHSSK